MLEIGVLETGVYQEESFNFSPESSGCAPSVSTGILITDFIPNPEGADAKGEWIELTNTMLLTANLCGWVLDDREGGSKPFALGSYTIEPGGFLKVFITDSKIALNNDGDSVRLFFNGDLIQEIIYDEIPEGMTYKDSQGEVGEAQPRTGGTTGTGDQGEGVEKSFTGTILINEIFPAPLADQEEWLELFNPSDESMDLSGLFIDDIQDGGSKPWPTPEGTKVLPHRYILFRKEQTKLALNNDGDSVRLIGPDGVILDTVTYPKLKRGLSYSRIHQRWCTTETPTPLKENICEFSLSLGERARVRGAVDKITEEISFISGQNSNSRSNNMIKNMYRYIVPSILPPSTPISSPFLTEVIAMARLSVSSSRVVLREDTGVEGLLIALGLFSGIWCVFGRLKI